MFTYKKPNLNWNAVLGQYTVSVATLLWITSSSWAQYHSRHRAAAALSTTAPLPIVTSFSLYERTGKTEINMQTKTPVTYCLRPTLHDYYTCNIGSLRTSMVPVTHIGKPDVAFFLNIDYLLRERVILWLPWIRNSLLKLIPSYEFREMFNMIHSSLWIDLPSCNLNAKSLSWAKGCPSMRDEFTST